MINRHHIISIFSAVILCSCAVDRTYEYEALTQHNIWMFDVMKEKYLWADNLQEQEWKDYFATPADYFTKLTEKGTNDIGSYIEIDSLNNTDTHLRGNFNHLNSYGFDFVLMGDPTNATTKSYARVVSVFAGSPAEKAGLQRNDFIESFNGTKLTAKNYTKLVNGGERELVVRTLTISSDETVLEWKDSRNVSLTASTYVEDKAFSVSKTFTIEDQTVGYIMCNRLIETPPEQVRSVIDYKGQMDQIIASMKSQNVSQLVLDLRLCNFGSFEMARRLASLIIPPASMGKYFAKTEWNSKNADKNDSITFDSSLADKTLDLDYVAVITSGYTQGAAEWLIRALKYALGEENVLLVGEATAGQPFMTEHEGDYDDMIHIYPAVAYVKDGNGEYDSASNGMIYPTKEVDEFGQLNLYEYGNIRETLLNNAINLIFHPETDQTTEDAKLR